MVELRIDTARDSTEEIRRVISYLQSVVGDAPSESSEDASEPAAGAFDMFGSDDDAPSDYAPNSSSSSRDDDDDDSVVEIVEF